MVVKTLAVAAGACALAAGAALAGTAASAAPAPVAAPAHASLASSAAAPATAVAAVAKAARNPALAAQRRAARCARVPLAITRTELLEKRLAAGASTKGSLAHLRARIAAADKARNAKLKATLEARLTYRSELASFLPHRLELLKTAGTTVCAQRPNS